MPWKENARMRTKPHREAAFPGELIALAVTPDPGCSKEDIRWAGEGDPARGVGPRFETAFARGGSHTVVATCGTDVLEFRVIVCPIERWLEDAAEFFGPSLDLSRVRVKASRFVLGPPGTGWTCNTVVRFKHPRSEEDLPSQSTFIHELAHVWQHQSGQAQLLKGLVEQVGRILGRDPYDFGGPEGARAARALPGLRKEAQAEIVRELWRERHGFDADRRGRPFSTPRYREDLTRLVEEAGIGRGPGGRRTIGRTVDSWLARLVNAALTALE
jgi:hypothetical protein